MCAGVQKVTGLVCLALLLSGCFEAEKEFTLNPEWSGKVRVQAEFGPTPVSAEEDDDSMIRRHVSEIMSLSAGVSAWDDISFEWNEDGWISFAGTAYFDDVSRLSIHNLQVFSVKWSKLDEGRYELVIDEAAEDRGATRAKPGAMSPAAIATEMARQRAAYPDHRRILVSYAAGMKLSLLFNLPGQVESRHNMTGAGAADARVALAGKDVIDAMDQLIRSDDWVKTQILAGYDLSQHVPFDDPAMREKLLGLPASSAP